MLITTRPGDPRQRGLFTGGSAALRGRGRATDPPPARAAAAALRSTRSTLQQLVLAAFHRVQPRPLDDEMLERLDEFAGYAPSTIRKRRSELVQAGCLVAIGEGRNSRGARMTRWGLRVPG